MLGGLFSAIGSVFGLRRAAPAIPHRTRVISSPASIKRDVPPDPTPAATVTALQPAPVASAPIQKAVATNTSTNSNVAAPEPADTEPVLLRREIVDAKLDVMAYEFSLRGELHGNVQSQRSSVRTFMDRMLIDHVNSVSAAVLRERRIIIPLSESSLRSAVIDALPARCSILLRPDNIEQAADARTLERIAALREAGVHIWGDDCPGSVWQGSAEGCLDGVTVRVATRMPMEISEALEALKRDFPKLPCAAWDVNTLEEFEAMRDLGCVSYSGAFITQRGNWSGNPLTPQVMCIAMLVTQVREDGDMQKIAAILRQDMALSYKIMRYVNNAAHGLNHQISSVEQALMLLGESQLDRWLTLMMLGRGEGGNGAVLEAALVRARFMELLGQGYRGNEVSERLFVLGLFSMLDLALRVPLSEAIRPLNLPAPMRDALLEKKGVLGTFLALAEASQNGDSQRVLQHAVTLGLTARKVNVRHLEALAWVNAPETTEV